jgi:cytochrome P450
VAALPKAAYQKVLLLIALAKRDESRWERSHQLDITRRVAGHIAFGTRIHGCVGQMVVRLEGEAVLGDAWCRSR